ncbi:MAG: site-specific integrase [Ruminococcus sp.]|nr:site-specific integrase [Ruminococcus sp.]
MSSISARKNKKGKIISYRLRYYRGEGVNPYTKTVYIPEGLSKRERERELKRLAVEFDRECEMRETNYDRSKTFANYGEYYIRLKGMKGLKKTTIINYDFWLQHINKEIGNLKLTEITPKILTDFYAKLFDEGIAASTIKTFHVFINGILEQAVTDEEIEKNPARRAVVPKRQRTAAKTLEKDELQAVIRALEDEEIMFKTLTMMLIYTGARRGEIMGLKWTDIDFDRRIATIERNVTRAGGQTIATTPKTQSSERLLALPQYLIDLLREYKKAQDKLIEAKGDEYHDEGWIFINESNNLGGMMNPDRYNRWLTSFCKRNGFEHINPHEFRHTAASLLINDGVDIVTVSKRLGHASTSTTINIYSHALKTADEVACDAFVSIVGVPTDMNKEEE